MKRVTLMTLVAIFSLSFSLFAQESTKNKKQDSKRMPTEMKWTAKDRAEHMAKQLDLTADQKEKVQALFEQQDAKRQEQVAMQQEKREEMAQDRAARRAEMMELRSKAIAENDAELEKIIGKEKMEQWKTYRDEQIKKMRNKSQSGRRNMNRNTPRTN
jgi:Spy/CpxP family protein refolding chaperone